MAVALGDSTRSYDSKRCVTASCGLIASLSCALVNRFSSSSSEHVCQHLLPSIRAGVQMIGQRPFSNDCPQTKA